MVFTKDTISPMTEAAGTRTATALDTNSDQVYNKREMILAILAKNNQLKCQAKDLSLQASLYHRGFVNSELWRHMQALWQASDQTLASSTQAPMNERGSTGVCHWGRKTQEREKRTEKTDREFTNT